MNVCLPCAWCKSLSVASVTLVVIGLWFGEGTAFAKPIKVLAFGDSLTAGYGLANAHSFTSQLKNALTAEGIDVVLINGGVSGDTSAGGRARLDWALSDEPDIVILELGANDGLRGLEPSETERNLDAIIAELQSRGIYVLLSGMKAPPNLGFQYGSEFNAVYPRLAKRYDVEFDPFFLEGVVADLNLNQADGIHPNEKGVGVIIKRLLPMIRHLIVKVHKNR